LSAGAVSGEFATLAVAVTVDVVDIKDSLVSDAAVCAAPTEFH
jgi:hypothetical protein